MADQKDNFMKLKSETPGPDQTPSAAGSTQSNKAVSQTEASGTFSYSTLDSLTPSATGIGQYAEGMAKIVHRADDVIGVTEQLRSSLPDNPSPAGSSPLNSASDGSGGPPTSTSPGSANSTPGSNQPQDPTNGGGGASGGNGGGNGGPTSSPGDGPDDGPNRGNGRQNDANPTDQKLSQVIEAIRQVTAAVESGSRLQGEQLVALQLEIRTLTSAVKDSTEQLRPAAQTVEQLGAATEALTQAIAKQAQNGKQVDIRLVKIAEEVTKLTEGLASIRIDDIVSGIETIRAQLESGNQINQDLLKELIAKDQASNGPVKLDETQLQTLTDAIAKLEKGQADQQALIASMGDKAVTLMELMLEEPNNLKGQMHGRRSAGGQTQSPPPNIILKDPKVTSELVNMIEELERTGAPAELDIKRFLDKLHDGGFINFTAGNIHDNRRTFEVTYDNPQSRTNPNSGQYEVTIRNSGEELYKAARSAWWPPVISVSAMGLGLSAIAVGAASVPVAAGLMSVTLMFAGVWSKKQNDQIRSMYDGVFKLPITQQAGTALSPHKMLLETLATYHQVALLPRGIRFLEWRPKSILNWAVDKEVNNDSYSSLGPLLVAMKNTIKFWDNFEYNIPNLADPTMTTDPTKVSELRTNEFDDVLEDFKGWLPRIKKSFLRIPYACERVSHWGQVAGGLAGTVTLVLGGPLEFTLKTLQGILGILK
ncbi:MAG: hypothetical protein ACK5HO_13650 [Pseudomonadota bacterium]|jgi:hypothetical protein